MKKIEIIQNVEEINDIELVKLTEYQLLDLINKDGIMEVLTNYEVPEDFILKWGPGDSEFNGIDKSLVISIMNLSEDFIRKNKEKIDWKIASIVNKFTEDERVEFNDLIIIYTDVVPNLDEIDEVYTVSDIRKLIKLSNATQDTEELKSKLDRVNKVEEENLRFEVKHKIERLTREDLLKIKETIRQSETKKSS